MTQPSEWPLTGARILIVDDQAANVELLEILLMREGYATWHSTTDARKALGLFQEFGADLVLLDLHMPHLDGIQVLGQLRAAQTAGSYLPILVLTADITPEARTRALKAGATDFLAKPLDLLEVGLRIHNMLATGYLYAQLQQQNVRLEEQVEARTAELRGANAQLWEEIEDRHKAEQLTKAAERKYRSLVEHLPIITYIVEFGEVNSFSYISPQIEQLLGDKPEDWVADPQLWDRHLHPDDRARVQETIRQADARGEVVNLEHRMIAKNGRVVWVHSWSVPVADESQTIRYAHGILEDITERKTREAELKQSEERFSKIFNASPIGITLASLDDGRIVDANAALYKMTGYPAEILLGKTVQALGMEVDQSIATQVENLLTTQHTIEGLETSFRRADGRLVDAMSALEVIELGERRYLLGLHQDITELKKRKNELEVIALISSALRKVETRAEMAEIILKELMGLLKVEAAILAIQETSGSIYTELGVGAWSGLTATHIPAAASISGRVLQEGKAYHNNTIQNDAQFAAVARVEKVKAVACAPLIANQRPFAVLWIGREGPIDKDEVDVLLAVADIAANALHRVALYEQTTQQLQRLSILRTVDQALTGSVDLQLILEILLDQVTNQLGAQAADFLLLEPNMLGLRCVASRGFHSRAIEQTNLRLGEGLAGRAALERRPVYVPDLNTAGTDFKRASLLATEGLKCYYAMPALTKGEVKGVLEFFGKTELPVNPDWEGFVEALAGQAAIAIDNTELFNDLQRSNFELGIAYDATLEGWSRALDLRDKETEGHSRRVTEMTLRLAQAMGISESERVQIRRGALLHDIGKLGIPDNILLKSTKLTPEEWEIMKKHPVYAYEMLEPIFYLHPALDIPYGHHEKWDGSGYPRGLKGETIPLAARMFAVVDVWDALRSDRPYRPGWSAEKVREFILAESGKHFDPQVVTTFLEILDLGV